MRFDPMAPTIVENCPLDGTSFIANLSGAMLRFARLKGVPEQIAQDRLDHSRDPLVIYPACICSERPAKPSTKSPGSLLLAIFSVSGIR
jgi:hypothetical protein